MIKKQAAIFILKKNENGERSRKASLHAATAALHSKPKVFFTSSPNSRSLACEVVSFRYRSISLVKRSACAAREVAACRRVDVFLIKSAPAVLTRRRCRLDFF
ncbi:MAG: hypothetical protein IKA71_04130 [Lentisphaeria bacterium]|nr:hypothetical protein [Lentisphaeria bacterium]